MTFERTRNWELIKRIVTHPKIYPHVSDDFCPPAEKWEPSHDESIWYVLCKDGEEVIALWLFMPHTQVCWQVHTCVLPAAYGPRARAAVEALAGWLWVNAPVCQRVVTDVPQYNRLAFRYALLAGMKEYGLNPKSYMKDGKLHDVILLGISRPGVA